jgi:hypothetical protein
MRCPRPPKSDILTVTCWCIEGRWTEIKLTILPSEGPSASGRCNCDTLSPKRSSNADVMNRGSADEAVVIVKFDADEVMVT